MAITLYSSYYEYYYKFNTKCKLIKYLRSQYPKEAGPQKALGLTFEKGEKISFHYSEFLYYNKFVKLDDNDIRFLGKYIIKRFIDDVDQGLVPYSVVNVYGYLFGGIIYRYAILENADDDVIESIKTFARCFRMCDWNLHVRKYKEPKISYFYYDGTQNKMPWQEFMPPLEIVNKDPVF